MDSKAPEQSAFESKESPGPIQGATVIPEYVERAVRIFGITEVEMDDLGLLNTAVAGSIAVCTLCIGLAIPTAIAILLSSVSGLAAFALWALVVVFAVAAIGAGALIRPLSKRRENTSARIKRQSRQLPKA